MRPARCAWAKRWRQPQVRSDLGRVAAERDRLREALALVMAHSHRARPDADAEAEAMGDAMRTPRAGEPQPPALAALSALNASSATLHRASSTAAAAFDDETPMELVAVPVPAPKRPPRLDSALTAVARTPASPAKPAWAFISPQRGRISTAAAPAALPLPSAQRRDQRRQIEQEAIRLARPARARSHYLAEGAPAVVPPVHVQLALASEVVPPPASPALVRRVLAAALTRLPRSTAPRARARAGGGRAPAVGARLGRGAQARTQ